jgi:hypothetical protein
MAITDILFHPIFLLNIGITLLVIGCLFFYIEIRNRQQNHKLVTMSNLISSIHNKVSEIDFYLTTTSGNRNGIRIQEEQHDNDDDEEQEQEQDQDENIRLITVSDDEYDDEDEDEDDDDDEDEDDDEDDDDEEDEDEEDEEDEHEDEHEDDKEDKQDSSIKVIKMKESVPRMDDENESISDVLKFNKMDVIELDAEDTEIETEEKETEETETEAREEMDIFNLKSIDILEVVDYTKYSVAKLKQIVAEKGLANDVSISKLKKNDLLKLLGVVVQQPISISVSDMKQNIIV